jgi:hypothetical protein
MIKNLYYYIIEIIMIFKFKPKKNRVLLRQEIILKNLCYVCPSLPFAEQGMGAKEGLLLLASSIPCSAKGRALSFLRIGRVAKQEVSKKDSLSLRPKEQWKGQEIFLLVFIYIVEILEKIKKNRLF